MINDDSIQNIVSRLIENNIVWRIIKKRRELKEHMKLQLDTVYKNMISHQKENKTLYDNNKELLKNMISNYESQYWNVDKYLEVLNNEYKKEYTKQK